MNRHPSSSPAPFGTATEVHSELGQITRQLHDALGQLGVMPQLHNAARGLPDARSRLEFIAAKTGQAADKVLTLVEAAKAERSALAATLSRLAPGAGAEVASSAALVDDAHRHLQRIDAMLTEIMLAQDFHDLTGQVVRKVVTLATELEDNLVKLLLKTAPAEATTKPARLEGPVVAPHGRSDVVATQSEVDDLLASLGF